MKVSLSLNALAALLALKAEREGNQLMAESLDFMRRYEDTPMKRDMLVQSAEQLFGVPLDDIGVA